ncbi:MAG: putative portal protein [Prokaryotic dsDNA virus sp.]|jgi:HK97 family phage portal protein|nr:MAG: putative portal protein [Prokaryotic dsDNA virus sp.]|tara:strand:+ start:352 stop:2571 length:2220 start_codon:yes stop_codon:yes gene_type:complete
MASLFDRFKSLLIKNSQQTAQQYNRAIYNWLGDSIVWNPENDDSYITEGYRKNATIYSLINLITKAATTIPFQVYEKTNENDYKRYKAMTSGTFDASTIHKASLLQKRSLVELEDTELHKILERPNPAQSYNTFISELIAFGKLTGNRYIYGIGPDTGANVGKYTELYVMPSQIMEIVSGGIMQPVRKYKIEYNGTFEIDASEICHIKDFNPYYDGTGSHLYGQSPLRAGLRSLTTNNEATQTGVKYLQNQTARGLLMSDEGDINEVQAQQLKDKFRRQFQGSDNAGDVIITPKKLSWVNFGLNAADVSLIEQYNASIKDLCNIYNVPVQLLNNTDSSSYNNMKEAKKALYQNAVIPELIKIKDELNRWLAPKYGDKLCIEFDFSVIPELQEETDKVVDQLTKAWWLTPNEKRAAMNYGKDEETSQLDDYFIPANLIPVQSNDVELEVEDIDVDVNKFLSKKLVPGMTDVFTTIDEAEARAQELGGSGTHEHEFDGEVVYMPFESHDEYEQAIEESKYHDEDDDEKKQMSARLRKALKKKVDDHNKEVNNASSKRTTVATLFKVYERGIGAYRTNPSSVRPNVSSPEQWAMARVNSYLYALKNGKFRSGKHDTDLLPEGHPMSSKDKSQNKNEMFDTYPQTATNNAKRMIEWREKYGDEVRAGTPTGWRRASMLANREPLTIEMLNRIKSFFARHEGNQTIADRYKDTPWRDNGYVSWNLWGGTAMRDWVNKKLNEIND